jgi:hypothetical protein
MERRKFLAVTGAVLLTTPLGWMGTCLNAASP